MPREEGVSLFLPEGGCPFHEPWELPALVEFRVLFTKGGLRLTINRTGCP
jgi:hypothetical protein